MVFSRDFIGRENLKIARNGISRQPAKASDAALAALSMSLAVPWATSQMMTQPDAMAKHQSSSRDILEFNQKAQNLTRVLQPGVPAL